jgi:hypothetical protein
MEDERLVKDLCEGSIKHLMDQPVSDTSFADVTLLGIKYMEVLITQCNEIFLYGLLLVSWLPFFEASKPVKIISFLQGAVVGGQQKLPGYLGQDTCAYRVSGPGNAPVRKSTFI